MALVEQELSLLSSSGVQQMRLTVILQIGLPSKSQDEVQGTELVLESRQMLVIYVTHDQYPFWGLMRIPILRSKNLN